jgi:translocation and assembly module TamB
VSLDARATGDLANPRLAGAATLSNGSFEDPLNGLKLTRIEARLRGQGEDVTIEQASAVARNGGPLAVTGRIRMAPAAGFPADLHLTARDAELVSNPIVTAVASLALDLSGPLAQRPRVTGRASIREMDVTIPQRMPFSNRPLAGAKHVKPTAAARQRLAMDKARAARQARGPAFEADLDLVVSAPSRIYVRGRGMDAELGGELRLTGTLGRPVAIGAFDLRRGKLEIAGQRLDFSRGKVDFAGDVTPNLDFVAETTASDVTAQVSVSGPASKPVFGFSSSPSLPQDEVISRLLFARASGSLSPVQALQLAQTVAELTGDGGPGSLDRIRRSLGVDSLDLRVDAAGKPTVGASRYITRNTRVGVRTGTKPEDSAVTLGVDLTRRLRAQGEVGADGKAAVGVGFEWEY